MYLSTYVVYMYVCMYVHRAYMYLCMYIYTCSLYRAFHNALLDYKHLQQENQRTYLNGTVHSHRKTEKVFFFFDNQRCSMCALQATRHTAIRYSSSCHKCVDMGASMFFTAAMIRPLIQRGHVAMLGR